jgi:transmembrane sensor
MSGVGGAMSLVRFSLNICRELRLRQIAREALAWRHILSQNDDQNAGFSDWLMQSPEHVRVWLELTGFDEQVAQALGYPPFGAIATSVNASAPAPSPLLQGLRGRGRQRLRVKWASACAAVMAATLIATIAFTYFVAPSTEYVTSVGGSERIVLADGSKVTLNTRSRIVVRFTKTLRAVELLEGEALFDLAPDRYRPFLVLTPDVTNEDVGTRFSVRRDARRMSVLVAEGRVRVHERSEFRSNGAAQSLPLFDLAQGEGVEFDERAGIGNVFQLKQDAVDRRLSWMDGNLRFEDETLATIVAEINRYNVREVVIADSSLHAFRLGGTFSPTDLDGFARALVDLRLCDVRNIVESDGRQVLLLESKQSPKPQ